jgi:hypothetical protein
VPPSTSTPTPAPVPPTPTPTPPTPQPVLTSTNLVPSTNTGDQASFYFMTFYNNDATCSSVSMLYDPVADPMNTGLTSNPVRLDKSQSQCFPIAKDVSVGVLSGTSRFLSFKQHASADCSGSSQNLVRMIVSSMDRFSTSCFILSRNVFTATQLYYRVTYVNTNVNALNYPLPGFGHESFDYDPVVGKFWLGNVYDHTSLYTMDPVRNAHSARPSTIGGNGMVGVEQVAINQNDFIFQGFFGLIGLRTFGEFVSHNTADAAPLLNTSSFSLQASKSTTTRYPVPSAAQLFVIAFGSHAANFLELDQHLFFVPHLAVHPC